MENAGDKFKLKNSDEVPRPKNGHKRKVYKWEWVCENAWNKNMS